MQDEQLSLALNDTKHVGLARGLESLKCSAFNIDHLFEVIDSAVDPRSSVSAGLLHRILTETNNFHMCSEDRLALLSRNEWLDGLG
jgi:hypothetical protein